MNNITYLIDTDWAINHLNGRTAVVKRLQVLGHGAVHLSDQGLERLADHDILQKARQAKRVLLVHDLGLGALVAASRATLPSVITFRLLNMHPDRINSALQNILSQHEEALENGVILSVTEGQVRVRSLPLDS